MNGSGLSRIKVALVPAPAEIVAAVAELSIKSGHQFAITSVPVQGTDLYVVYATRHPLPDVYSMDAGTFGFRVPNTFPNAGPEDCFFLLPDSIKLKKPDKVRNSFDLNRATSTPNFFSGPELGGAPALVFSWHLWNTVPWDRRKNTLVDHYGHCLRRFDGPEHDG